MEHYQRTAGYDPSTYEHRNIKDLYQIAEETG